METATVEQVNLRPLCDCCGGKIMLPNGLPAYYRLEGQMVSVNKSKAHSQLGLASYFGQGNAMAGMELANIMGPSPDMLDLGEKFQMQICMNCYAEGEYPLGVMAENANATDGK